MSNTFDSVYPDFLRTGLGKLNQLDACRELLALFSTLEHFRRDLHDQNDPAGILVVGHWYVAGLNLFRSMGFWLVSPTDMSFDLSLARPEEGRATLQRTVEGAIKTWRCAFAVRQHAPGLIQTDAPGMSEACVRHSLAVSRQVMGMFCGLLQRELSPVQEVAFSLHSLMFGESADALATLHRTGELAREIEPLSEMLPLCA